MGFLIMIKELRDGFVEELEIYAEKLQAFNVRLSLNFITDIGVEEQNRIMAHIIRPLFNGARNAYLYNDGENEYYDSILSNITKRARNKFELILCKELFSDELLSFWSSKDKKRGTILWENTLSNIDIKKHLQATKDPFVLGNMSAILPKSAISHAKKVTKQDKNIIIFCLSSIDGFESIAMFMSPEVIGEYVKAAIENCTLSESYLLRYSAPASL